eukprot:g17909.t1
MPDGYKNAWIPNTKLYHVRRLHNVFWFVARGKRLLPYWNAVLSERSQVPAWDLIQDKLASGFFTGIK